MNQKLIEGVRRHFTSRGYAEVSVDKLGNFDVAPTIAFQGKDGLVFVKFIDNPEILVNRSLFADAFLGAGSLRDRCNVLYVAVPPSRYIAPNIDSEVLEKYGIGLLQVGEDGRVVEAQRAVPRPIRTAPNPAPDVDKLRMLDVVPALERRIAELEELVANLRGTVSRLQAQLASLSGKVERLASTQPSVREVAKPAELEAPQTVEPPTTAGIPSFLQDNPWVAILSKRGEGGGSVAS
ncbi:hypothetical protein DRO02_07860 [archaeon]|nr:MAG: hypothetical protein DRO02_07860 [archaeon]